MDTISHDVPADLAASVNPGLRLARADELVAQRIAHRMSHDPHGLTEGAPLVFAAYQVAHECYPGLLSGTLGHETVISRLRKLAPRSAFELACVTRQAVKLINPHGHGANSPRFSNEALGRFREKYPGDSHLTAGFTLLVCAAKWWTHEQGDRAVTPRVDPLITSDLDHKLRSFGFLLGERDAICRMLRRPPARP